MVALAAADVADVAAAVADAAAEVALVAAAVAELADVVAEAAADTADAAALVALVAADVADVAADAALVSADWAEPRMLSTYDFGVAEDVDIPADERPVSVTPVISIVLFVSVWAALAITTVPVVLGRVIWLS